MSHFNEGKPKPSSNLITISLITNYTEHIINANNELAKKKKVI